MHLIAIGEKKKKNPNNIFFSTIIGAKYDKFARKLDKSKFENIYTLGLGVQINLIQSVFKILC